MLQYHWTVCIERKYNRAVDQKYKVTNIEGGVEWFGNFGTVCDLLNMEDPTKCGELPVQAYVFRQKMSFGSKTAIYERVEIVCFLSKTRL